MYGYIIAGVLASIVLVFVISGLAQSKPGPGAARKKPEDRPVQANNPSADEPTPDKSVTATKGEIRHARDHTPPA